MRHDEEKVTFSPTSNVPFGLGCFVISSLKAKWTEQSARSLIVIFVIVIGFDPTLVMSSALPPSPGHISALVNSSSGELVPSKRIAANTTATMPAPIFNQRHLLF